MATVIIATAGCVHVCRGYVGRGTVSPMADQSPSLGPVHIVHLQPCCILTGALPADRLANRTPSCSDVTPPRCRHCCRLAHRSLFRFGCSGTSHVLNIASSLAARVTIGFLNLFL